MSLAATLKQLRLKNRRSLQDVADAVGASKTHIWDLETGRSSNPSMELLTALADYYQVRVSDLVGENPDAEGEDPELVAMYRGLKDLKPDDRKAIRVIMETFRHRKTEDG